MKQRAQAWSLCVASHRRSDGFSRAASGVDAGGAGAGASPMARGGTARRCAFVRS